MNPFNLFNKDDDIQSTKNTFMHRLEQLRKSKNLSQSALSKELKISQMGISKYENGVAFPTIPVLVKLARYFNVTVDFLLGEDYWPVKHEYYSYIAPEGYLEFSFRNTNYGFDYIFGLIIDTKEAPDVARGAQPYICIVFNKNNMNLYKKLFVEKSMPLLYLMLVLSYTLGVRFIGPSGISLLEDQILGCNFVICVQNSKENEYYMVKDIESKEVALESHPGWAGIIEQWTNLSEEQKNNILIRRFREIKNPQILTNLFIK